MRRTSSAVAMLLVVAGLTTGCGILKRGPSYSELTLEVSGGTAEKIVYSVPPGMPGEPPPPQVEVPTPQLPWRDSRVVMGGEVTVRVIPKGAPATCRIVVEKKEVARKQGQPGTELTCIAKIEK